jgi:hypothetical protein
MLKQWELEYILDLVNDETDRLQAMAERGVVKKVHMEQIKELKENLLNMEYEEGD